MKSHYRVVVIGGGVVGTSVLYHLAKMGWTDVALLERKVLTAGSSWHAAGGFHALNADPNIAQLQAYTIDLLSEIEKESGQSVGMHMTGGLTLAGTPDRWDWLQSAYRTFQAIGIDDVRLVTPEEAGALCPIMSTEGILGGMWADREGYVDTTGTVHAYAGAAKKRGAEVHEGVKVEALRRVAEGWDVVTKDHGTIRAEHVVNAAGLWAKQVGRMAGIELPVSPLNHHYLISDTIPELEEIDFEVPMTVDLEGFTYMRQDQKGILLGIYEIDHQHWMEDGAPWDYGFELQQEDPDRIEKELILGFERYPALQEVGVKTWVNGAFTFAPDGNPLVGPIQGLPGYWCACGVMAGFLQGGGVGKSLAEWIVEGEPEADVFGMDVARFGRFAENKRFIRETTGQFYTRRFVMTYPNEQLPAGRPLKMAPAHDAMTAAGARWGVSYGLEVPLYFAPSPEFEEKPTLKRSNAFDIVAEECRATREAAGLLDISAFSRFEVTGPNAGAWLDRIMASKLPAPGRARLAPMLSPQGKLKGDLTVFCWPGEPERFWITGSYYLRAWHMRWFHDQMQDGVHVADISDEMVGFSVQGPNAKEIVQRVLERDLDLPFMGCAEMDVGLTRAHVGRLSVSGERGYEISVPAMEHVALRRTLLEAGQGLGLREIGFQALLSLRLEKSFGIWSAEFTQGYTPAETGMDRWIDWTKAFVGKGAAEGVNPSRRIVTMEIDADGADASGFEPIWRDGEKVGFVTSGGFGHTIGKSLAMGMVQADHSDIGTALQTHIVGQAREAIVIPPSPYDPEGRAMRGA
ncbi:GcvT family protein [Jannaschia seohaensis]|uniref:Dimethylglycine dehydrogenase n=1 Tax=Jannaschia seohaensis TaxID=475081 RepID=A0A2Y9B1F3_9RHOB|nr:FAD-dependent oxidoreductase [Jannaschia seohaensis]PWJ13778.1 dimethylglycine dehydrogenase [Jannaschia seohaensis]SSA50291.1 dimethylglycine dehydrogenase [Jannaschia seohaensis]